jgi:hypothetical protein
MILHIPNEGKNNGRLVSIGLYPGAADLFIYHKWVFVFVEVKDAKGKQSPNQIEFEQHCHQSGIEYGLVRSLEEFQQLIKNL